MEKPDVNDEKLTNLLGDLYSPGAKVGSGSTADALRAEMATGESAGGRFHFQKAQDYSTGLEGWLRKNPTGLSGDRAAAENVLIDLRNALGGK